MKEMKQVILVRTDLDMPLGKTASQVAHASVGAVMESSKAKVAKWRAQGEKKVVLAVEDEDELYAYEERAIKAKLKTCLIQDAGHTILEPGTTTCLGIGPDFEEKMDKVTGQLEPL